MTEDIAKPAAADEALIIPGPAGRIEAALDCPEGDAPAQPVLAIVCHPLPTEGGSMHNKVVTMTARALSELGLAAVRFNFRGVGASAGVHDDGQGELDDLLAVVQHMAPEGPIALAGFSFGAFVTSHALARLWSEREVVAAVLVGTAASRFTVAPVPPEAHLRTLVVHGEHDETVPLTSVMDWARPQTLPVTVVPGGGHFFHGQLPLLRSLATRHLQAVA